jgi:murein L,D-transpeptidase YafK
MKTINLGISFIILFLFSGCIYIANPNYKKGNYKLSECKKELRLDQDFRPYQKIDQIIVDKSKRRMYLYKGKQKSDTFRISLSKNKGKKIQRGDLKVPEGRYYITKKICHSKYYRMIYISFPNEKDKLEAQQRGVSVGSGITIHAQPFWNKNGKGDGYTLSKNWTNGCIAVTNKNMDRLWYAVDAGTPIEIRP